MKARINFSKKIGHVVKLMCVFLNEDGKLLSALYANIAPKWNTMTSCKRQDLETLKALP